MDANMRDALRAAGAEAGREQRKAKGLPTKITDPVQVQVMADLLRKAGERR